VKISDKGDLSLRLLEVFSAVMLHQTTVDAAAELGVSQPAVSLAIKQLEAQLGFSLFERRSQRLQPTQEARSLFAQIEPILLQLRSVGSHVQDLRNGTAGVLKIIATPPMGHSVVPKVLQHFLSERPGVGVQYDVRRMENVIEDVEVGSAELGLVLALDAHPAVNVRQLSADLMVAMVPADHPLAQAAQITPQDCLTHGHIGLDTLSRLGTLLRKAFDQEGVPYIPRVVVRYCHTAAVLANAGMGIAIVDRYTAQFMGGAGLVARPFVPDIRIGACLLTRRDVPLSRLASQFVEAVEAMMGQGTGESAASPAPQ
jgi:DNA-binding transcriptional LysR family regulator